MTDILDLLDVIELPTDLLDPVGAAWGFVGIVLALLGIRRATGLVSDNHSAPHQASAGLKRLCLRWLTQCDRLYDRIAGVHPHRRLWHCQWLAVEAIYKDLRHLLPSLEGRVLDVGCLGKPYAPWLTGAREHIGADVTPGPMVDVVIADGAPWPIPSDSVNAVLCTQVVQVVGDLPHFIREMERVMAPGATAIVTIPFCYNDMSMPLNGGVYKDYSRLSLHGSRALLSEAFDVLDTKPQGGIGSTAGMLVLNWIRVKACNRLATHMLFTLAMPAWLAFCACWNAGGWLLDRVDGTGLFYHNVQVIVRKRPAA